MIERKQIFIKEDSEINLDFNPSDIRHSQADVSNAQLL